MIPESQEALESISRALLRSSPENDWTRIELRVTAAGRMLGTSVMTTQVDGTVDRFRGIDDAGEDACHTLRQQMYQPGKGAWYNALFTLDNSLQFEAEFDYETPPFDGLAAPGLLEDDQRIAPRRLEDLPPWHPMHVTS
jgi:hypothetical protein